MEEEKVEEKSSKKQVIVILGSPRKKGNSAILAEQISKGVRSAGAKVETIFLQGLKIAPCQSCYACQKHNSKGCAIKDDMQAIYLKLIKAEAWVIASPVYWFTMSAQTKIFMDRCFALAGLCQKSLFRQANRHRHELRRYGSLFFRRGERPSHFSGCFPVYRLEDCRNGLWECHERRGY